MQVFCYDFIKILFLKISKSSNIRHIINVIGCITEKYKIVYRHKNDMFPTYIRHSSDIRLQTVSSLPRSTLLTALQIERLMFVSKFSREFGGYPRAPHLLPLGLYSNSLENLLFSLILALVNSHPQIRSPSCQIVVNNMSVICQ